MKATEIFGIPGPLISVSFSSRGFKEVAEIMKQTLPHIKSSFLISLFDAYHISSVRNMIFTPDERVRIWDSGGYETNFPDDLSTIVSALPSSLPWSINDYINAANSIPWNGKDILVNFDRAPSTSVSQQIDLALSTYERIRGIYKRDVLIHISVNHDIDQLVAEIAKYLTEIDILGFTEKEIAPTWKRGVGFIHALRQKLEQHSGYCPPIHLFGCLDPKSVIYFSHAGVNIFDGLSWLRYFFHEGTTLYRREYEFVREYIAAPLELSIDMAINLHNIRQLEELQSDLVYAFQISDPQMFAEEKLILAEVLQGHRENQQ